MAMVVPASAGHAQRVVPLSSDEGAEMAAGIEARAPEPEIIELGFTKAAVIDLPVPIRDVVVANPDIADVVVQTPRQVFVIGHSPGGTNMFFLDQAGNVVKHVIINVQADLEEASRALKELFPDAVIKLRNVNSNVIMTGTVRTAQDSIDAQIVVSRYVEYEDDEGESRAINMLRIVDDMQVMLRVQVSEMNRSVLKTLGFNTNFNRVFNNAENAISLGVGALPAAAETLATGAILIDDLGFGSVNFGTLERQGLIKTLAEPMLTAISGETASFLAGGEFPVPAAVGLGGSIAFEFRQFGVVLSFTPVVLSDNRISLRVVIEVSQLSVANSIVIGGTTIPGFTTRRAETTVTLPSGGSLMIAGLIQNDEINTVSGVPGLKDLPILGALFRSTRFQRSETELVVMVTPYRIAPTDSRRPMSMPTDGFVPSSDMDVYLFGRLHKRYTNLDNLNELPPIFGPIGYSME